MKLVNITNSNPTLVSEQLAHTDAHLVELYSLGRTTIIYTDAKTHSNLILLNKRRPVKQTEIDIVLEKLFKTHAKDPRLEYIPCSNFIEISLTKS